MQLLNDAMLRVINWMRRDEGQTLVEYGLIIGLISVLVVVLAVFLDTPLRTLFQTIGGHLTSVA